MQEICQRYPSAGQGNAFLGHLCDSRGYSEEYADVTEGSWRTAESSNSGTSLESTDGINKGFSFFLVSFFYFHFETVYYTFNGIVIQFYCFVNMPTQLANKKIKKCYCGQSEDSKKKMFANICTVTFNVFDHISSIWRVFPKKLP